MQKKKRKNKRPTAISECALVWLYFTETLAIRMDAKQGENNRYHEGTFCLMAEGVNQTINIWLNTDTFSTYRHMLLKESLEVWWRLAGERYRHELQCLRRKKLQDFSPFIHIYSTNIHFVFVTEVHFTNQSSNSWYTLIYIIIRHRRTSLTSLSTLSFIQLFYICTLVDTILPLRHALYSVDRWPWLIQTWD